MMMNRRGGEEEKDRQEAEFVWLVPVGSKVFVLCGKGTVFHCSCRLDGVLFVLV